MLIIGATSTGLFKRFTIGSVASALLHASTVPVALAPHGYHRQEALTRISCGLGTRAGRREAARFRPRHGVRTGTCRCAWCRFWRSTAACGRLQPTRPGSMRPSALPTHGCRRAGVRRRRQVPGGRRPGGGEDGNRRRPRAQHRGSRGPPGLGRRRGPVDRIQPACHRAGPSSSAAQRAAFCAPCRCR